ncbi:MAG: AAA family ATPase [Caldilineaceae bacterium SB0662_bin_9]|uniref:AAA family ATPase n=1 Tax=Caldilineaceae bacterium SB0662_bin_9 TaxID=2605258 RepID=A0A6B1DZH4_9CHLR|nr:AAA family ATPase [Caldilineaceae bacterium SB0662_bin_9]
MEVRRDGTGAHTGQWRIAGNGFGRSFQLADCNKPRCALGRQFPPLHTGCSEFIEIRDQGGLYVDKTGFFRKLLEVTPVKSGGIPPLAHKFQFLARPRRFGKSVLVSTLEA